MTIPWSARGHDATSLLKGPLFSWGNHYRSGEPGLLGVFDYEYEAKRRNVGRQGATRGDEFDPLASSAFRRSLVSTKNWDGLSSSSSHQPGSPLFGALASQKNRYINNYCNITSESWIWHFPNIWQPKCVCYHALVWSSMYCIYLYQYLL